MTEEEWLIAITPWEMLNHLDADAGGRQAYLFSAACLRRIWHLLPGPRSRSVAELLERLADSLSNDEKFEALDELTKAREAARGEGYSVKSGGWQHPSKHAALAASEWSPAYLAEQAAEATDCLHAETQEEVNGLEAHAQCRLLREIFANPFRPVAFDPTWRTSNVALAAQMYESRYFSTMPILADALQDAGCDDADILDHCRGFGSHVRGCWVVDLALGNG